MGTLRLLAAGDIEDAMELSREAGWNQTREDWARLLALEPEGCFGIEADGHVVATATLLTHGAELGWIGMVLTRSDYRRRGYARELLVRLLDVARQRRIRTLKLDATDQGRPLYGNLGFQDEQPVERWMRQPGIVTPEACDTGPLPLALDRDAFGADRTRFLEALASQPFVTTDGYCMARPGSRARYVGPCVARDPYTAERLIRRAILTDPEQPWFWDLLPANTAAAALADNLKFEPVRRLVRMRLGEPLRNRDSMVYAIGGFEAG